MNNMKTLYYTVYFDTYNGVEQNGLRTITVYEIIENQPKIFTTLECTSDDFGIPFYTDEEEIQEWLDDNGYGDEEFKFEQL